MKIILCKSQKCKPKCLGTNLGAFLRSQFLPVIQHFSTLAFQGLVFCKERKIYIKTLKLSSSAFHVSAIKTTLRKESHKMPKKCDKYYLFKKNSVNL